MTLTPPFWEMLRDPPRWLVVCEALILVAVIGWVDFVTGWEFSLFVLYSAPLLLVVWKTNLRIGFLFVVLCAVTWWGAHDANHPYHTNWGFALALTSRCFYFAVFVVAVAAVKNQGELLQSRIEMLEHAHALESGILLTTEREQQRIGRDLHDDLGPRLAAIKYAGTFLADELRQRDQPESARAEQVVEMAGGAISLVRDLARGLFPVQIDGPGLSIALEELARTMSRVTGLNVSFNESGSARVEKPEDAIHLFRIAQEAVNNAAKHGGARKVAIILNKSDTVLRLTVADDGKGITPDCPRGMGMHSMSYRARALGGNLQVDSNPNEGTVISCEIPNPSPRPEMTMS